MDWEDVEKNNIDLAKLLDDTLFSDKKYKRKKRTDQAGLSELTLQGKSGPHQFCFLRSSPDKLYQQPPKMLDFVLSPPEVDDRKVFSPAHLTSQPFLTSMDHTTESEPTTSDLSQEQEDYFTHLIKELVEGPPYSSPNLPGVSLRYLKSDQWKTLWKKHEKHVTQYLSFQKSKSQSIIFQFHSTVPLCSLIKYIGCDSFADFLLENQISFLCSTFQIVDELSSGFIELIQVLLCQSSILHDSERMSHLLASLSTHPNIPTCCTSELQRQYHLLRTKEN